MNNNEIFLNNYNKLDSLLRAYYNDSNLSNSVITRRINELKKSDVKEIKLRGVELDSIRNIRNILVHSAKIDNLDPFVVSSSSLDSLNKEIESLLNTKDAYSICTKYKDLLICNKNSDIKSLIIKMRKEKHSNVPVIENNKVVGIFNESNIITNLLENNFKCSLNMSDLNLSLDSNYLYYYDFIPKNMKIIDIEKKFEIKKNDKNLSILFVTNNGTSNEDLLGLIKIYDVLKNN